MPMNVLKKNGLRTTTLIRCMAETAWLAGNWASAFMTDVEKAKKTPPTVPAPMQARSVRAVSMSGVYRTQRVL